MAIKKNRVAPVALNTGQAPASLPIPTEGSKETPTACKGGEPEAPGLTGEATDDATDALRGNDEPFTLDRLVFGNFFYSTTIRPGSVKAAPVLPCPTAARANPAANLTAAAAAGDLKFIVADLRKKEAAALSAKKGTERAKLCEALLPHTEALLQTTTLAIDDFRGAAPTRAQTRSQASPQPQPEVVDAPSGKLLSALAALRSAARIFDLGLHGRTLERGKPERQAKFSAADRAQILNLLERLRATIARGENALHSHPDLRPPSRGLGSPGQPVAP